MLAAIREFRNAKFFLRTPLSFCAKTLLKCRLQRDMGVFVFILTSNSAEKLSKKYKKSIFGCICMLMPSAGRNKLRGASW